MYYYIVQCKPPPQKKTKNKIYIYTNKCFITNKSLKNWKFGAQLMIHWSTVTRLFHSCLKATTPLEVVDDLSFP